MTVHWRHNECDGVSNHQRLDCLLNRLFRRRSNKPSKCRVTGLCGGNPPWPLDFPPKGPATPKMFLFVDVIIAWQHFCIIRSLCNAELWWFLCCWPKQVFEHSRGAGDSRRIGAHVTWLCSCPVTARFALQMVFSSKPITTFPVSFSPEVEVWKLAHQDTFVFMVNDKR